MEHSNQVIRSIAFIFLVGMTTFSVAAWTISEPVQSATYQTDATIACNGNAPNYSDQATLKLFMGQTIVDSHTVHGVESQWSHDLVPDDYWEAGTYKVELWKDGQLIQGLSRTITVSNPE